MRHCRFKWGGNQERTLQSAEKSERNGDETGTLEVCHRGNYISEVKYLVETCCTLLDIGRGSDPQALQGLGKMLWYLLTDPSLSYPAPEVVEVVSSVGGF